LTIALLYIDKFSREIQTDVRGLSSEAIKAFRQYSWPRNLAELSNTIEGAMTFDVGSQITTTFLPPAVLKEPERTGEIRYWAVLEDGETLMEHLDRIGLEIIQLVLCQYGGNKTRAARRLGMSRRGLASWVKRARRRLERSRNRRGYGESRHGR
jgi:two-component system, NtrC family, response regulator HydG